LSELFFFFSFLDEALIECEHFLSILAAFVGLQLCSSLH